MRSAALAGEELSRLLSNRLLRLAVAVVALVPLLYGALYLWAFWDPNGAIDRIPVAVVNADVPVEIDGTTIAAGDDVVAELLERKTMDWHVVDADKAEAGVQGGAYYLALTIPQGFSAALASADSTTPTRATLLLTKHESRNMLASQIGDRVFAEVRAAASASASEHYFDEIFVGFAEMRGELGDAASGAEQLATGLDSAAGGAGELSDGLGTASDGARRVASGARKVSAGAHDTEAGAAKVAGGARELSKGLATVDSGAGRLAAGANQALAGSADLADGGAALSAGAKRLSSSAHELSTGAQVLDDGVSQAVAGASAAQGGASQVSQGARGTADALAALAAAHPELSDDPAFQQASAAAERTRAGAAQLSAGLDANASRLGALAAGARQVAEGSARLAAGSDEMAGGAARLSDGAARLASGADSLADGANALSAGVSRAHSGASTLSSGAIRLARGTGELARGAGTLAQATGALSGGVSRLSSGASQLDEGLVSAADGSSELASGLTAGVKELPALTASQREANAAMMSDPVELEKRLVGAVPNYGTGFAPYFVPLSLWVGAMVVFFIVPPVSDRALQDGGPAWIAALSGFWAAALLGIAQAVLLLAVLHYGLGLEAHSTLALFAFATLVSLVFIAILQWLSTTFGLAGKFFAIVLLMLQLTSSAGTYPLETLPVFFRAVNPLLPMTYVVGGLREVISGGDWSIVGRDAGVLLGFGLAALGSTAISVRLRRAGRLKIASAEF